ncbi:TolC family protein [Victivallis sp. Marseille-Q1083]|uniref:TolC family protein n=1 Tax=Victivallis sp. Marseille-Q1083 TaxID=2717288 RepID=UPI00158DD39D|nr:TolC family protein [Victivallis sp. Marseille-Q1083]
MKICRTLVGVGAAGMVLLAGCKSFDEYQDDRIAYAVKHFERAQYSNIDSEKVLTLNKCVALAVQNNLDLKVFGLEENVAKEMRTSEMLGMLPELNVSNNLTGRTNTPASSSQQLHGEGSGTYSYSQSQARNVNYLNVDLALSVLDFGLAFFNTQQANDRMLLRQQIPRRAEQNLVLDTVRVYFQVAAAQRAIDITTRLLEDCKDRYELIEQMGESGQISPFRAFDEVRQFIDMEKRLTNYIRSYDNSCVELRSLLGLYPNTRIKVDDSILDQVPEFTLPEMELMEQIALMKRPELYEIDMQKHINVLECRKTIAMMFPNVRMFVDFTNSDNSFLYHSAWWELGIRAAYNLLRLPQQISRYQAYSAQVDAEEARSYAQAIGVIAQVRIAHADLVSVKERYNIDVRVNAAYRKNLAKAEASDEISGELSQLELAHMRLATTETEIEKYLSLGNYYVSYFRLLNTLGIEDLHAATVEGLKNQLDEERIRAEAELEEARAEYESEQANVEADSEQAEITEAEEQLDVAVSPPTEPAR